MYQQDIMNSAYRPHSRHTEIVLDPMQFEYWHCHIRATYSGLPYMTTELNLRQFRIRTTYRIILIVLGHFQWLVGRVVKLNTVHHEISGSCVIVATILNLKWKSYSIITTRPTNQVAGYKTQTKADLHARICRTQLMLFYAFFKLFL